MLGEVMACGRSAWRQTNKCSNLVHIRHSIKSLPVKSLLDLPSADSGKMMLPYTDTADDQIIDQIYEAAIVPENWPNVMDSLAPLADCDGGFVFVVDELQHVRFASSERYVPLLNTFVNDGWIPRNLRAPRAAAMQYPGFLVDYDLVTIEETQNDPFYTELLQPHGAGWATGTVVPAPSGDLIVFNLERAHARGPIERAYLPRLDRLRPHLARAGLMSVRLHLERARATTEALGRLGLPAAVLGRNGRMLAANDAFDALSGQFVTRAFDALALADRSADNLLRQALDQIDRGQGALGSRSIPVAASDKSQAMIAHLLPVKGAARDIFSSAVSVLMVTPLSAPSAPTIEVLNGLFDLSPAEARVTQGIVKGETVDTLASAMGLSRETIRTQLKAVMLKTGTTRQAELVGLLASTNRLGTL